MNKIIKVIIVVLVIIIVNQLMRNGIDYSVDSELQKIENQVAIDAVKQYEIAKRNGNSMDAYVQAGFAAAAFLQAKDEKNYKKWKDIENREAKSIGLIY